MHKKSTYRVLALLLALGMLFSILNTTAVQASGTVDAFGQKEVAISIDPTGAGLTQPDVYLAELKIKHNTPYTYPNIPVTLHLIAPSTYGTVKGTVSGLKVCDVDPTPLKDAEVNFWQGGSIVYTTSTNAAGYYTYAIPAGTYDVEFVYSGYINFLETDVQVVGGSTLTIDGALRPIAPCLSVVPTRLEQTQAANTTTTQTLTIVNSGAAAGNFELIELPFAAILADQLLQDPSFEEYTPNPYWGEYSQNYGTPLCTVADCGDGTGTGPRTGLVWAWFGGSSSGDQGYVSQTVTILPGTAEMSFYVEQYVCGTAGAANYLTLEIDGNELWRTNGLDPACGVFGYRPISVDVTAYADGTSHEVKFRSVTVGSGNFFVDDVELNLEPGADVPWLSENPVAGSVPPDSSLVVDIGYDSTGLAVGDYLATLLVKNPPAAAINIPVTLHVVTIRNFYIPLLFK